MTLELVLDGLNRALYSRIFLSLWVNLDSGKILSERLFMTKR